MSKDIYTKVKEELRDEFIGSAGGGNPLIDTVLNSLLSNKAEEYKIYKIKPTKERLKKDIKDILNIVSKTVIDGKEYRDQLYKKSYDKLKALVDEGKSWGDIFTEIYSDEKYLNDIFIRLIEEKEGVVITSAKQLQELSGITEIKGYWSNEKEEIIPYNGKKTTKKEAIQEAKDQIEDTFIKGMDNRYSDTLERMLEAGAKYKDLLLIEPKYFNLPETWNGTLSNDKYSTILWAISMTYLINEPAGLILLPSLRTIADEIEAPYSVVMDCFKLFNK